MGELLRLLAEIGALVDSFLPRAVTLQEWADQRIPEEQSDIVNSSGIVYVRHGRSAGRQTPGHAASAVQVSRTPEQATESASLSQSASLPKKTKAQEALQIDDFF